MGRVGTVVAIGCVLVTGMAPAAADPLEPLEPTARPHFRGGPGLDPLGELPWAMTYVVPRGPAAVEMPHLRPSPPGPVQMPRLGRPETVLPGELQPGKGGVLRPPR